MQVKKQQLEPYMEQLIGSKMGKEYDKAVYCYPVCLIYIDFPSGTNGKEPACLPRRHKGCRLDPWLGRSLEEGMATHSSILAWRISWKEKPGRLQSIGLQRVGHN